MRRIAILFSLSIIVLTILSCDENKPEQITSEISINNTVSPIKLIEGVIYENEAKPCKYYNNPPYSLLVIGENDIAFIFNIYNKKEDKLPTGTYTIDEEQKQDDLTIFGSIGEVYPNDKTSVKTRSINDNDDEGSIIITDLKIIKQGNMEISTKNQHYTIRFDGIDEEERRVSFTYQGGLTITTVELKDK